MSGSPSVATHDAAMSAATTVHERSHLRADTPEPGRPLAIGLTFVGETGPFTRTAGGYVPWLLSEPSDPVCGDDLVVSDHDDGTTFLLGIALNTQDVVRLESVDDLPRDIEWR